jgi:hypothetical protein
MCLAILIAISPPRPPFAAAKKSWKSGLPEESFNILGLGATFGKTVSSLFL